VSDLDTTPVRETLLAKPCWRIDIGIDYEDGYLHFGSRDEAYGYHVTEVRKQSGMPLSEASAFALLPAVIRPETYCCVLATCPDCGVKQHSEGPFEVCAYDCGWYIPDVEPSPTDPDQEPLFEVLRTDDIDGQPASMLVLFEEDCDA
jgi:hypothetical protein